MFEVYLAVILVSSVKNSNVFLDVVALVEFNLLLVFSAGLLLFTTQKLSAPVKSLHLLLYHYLSLRNSNS